MLHLKPRRRTKSLEPAANPAPAQCLARSEGGNYNDDENLSSSLPIYTGVFLGFGCSRIKYRGCARMEYWESLLIGLCFPFPLLSPPSSTFFFFFTSYSRHISRGGLFCYRYISCALKSIFELHDKLVDPPFLWSTPLQSASSSSLLVSFLLILWRNLHFLLTVGRGLLWWLLAYI